MAMAARAVNSYSVFRCASSPPLSVFRCRRLHHFGSFSFRRVICSRLGFRFPNFRSGELILHCDGVHSLVDCVMEELEAIRSRKRARAAIRMGLTSNEILVDKLEKRMLQTGLLLEFRKDSERMLLAVAQKPDGKKNWMVTDQVNGVTSSIKPQQITYVVPGVENFDHLEISCFLQKAEDNLDPILLEYAWVELLEKNKSVTAEELAEIIFGSSDPMESYCAHLLLSKDEIYFTVVESKGFRSVYGPRTAAQVEELIRSKNAKEAAERELQEFVQLLESAKAMPLNSKPSKQSWTVEEKTRRRIEALESYAIDAYKSDEQKRTAGVILRTMGMPKLASSAINLLIDIGYFPVHVNLDLLKLNVRTEYSDDILSAAEDLLSMSPDSDETIRKDLTHLKVYAIDVDEADELDDALSATRMQDGRIKVWIHVADPTSLVQPGSKIDREAMRRGTSIFLPTATFPMFPEKLAMEGMSLQQGKLCRAVTVSVTLHSDGSIAEYEVVNSVIRPTYMLTYESANELIHLNLEEEAELKLLSEAATLRLQWRRQQGAIDTATIEPRIKVPNPDDPEPSITLYVENQADPAMRLVTEMMILCGEAVATFGSFNNIPLPYRGQPQSNINAFAFAHLPEGPVRSAAYVKVMRAVEMDFRKAVRHGILGVPGYVQFTSPIRRYMDLLAHYQVKAFLRGDLLPFTAGQLEGMSSLITIHSRMAKRLFNSSLRYWLLEYLRRQPKEKKFQALILRFIKNRTAALLLIEVGMQASAWVSAGKKIGDEIEVQVEEAHPRDDVLSLKEIVRE
ncbi:hypothetical protein Scep_015812 [Stephania cephalantha]|uniref:RNB domain-containing protein n=1 Tax=Stephania cephalantha TaxID=152367 RepID=A0AAP0J3N2_9MAGN